MLLLTVQTVVAIIVYISLSNVPTENVQNTMKSNTAQEVSWSYDAVTGSKEWVSIDPSYYACGGGYEQSPIHIESNGSIEEQIFDSIKYNYKPTKFWLSNDENSLVVHDPTGKNKLLIDGEQYKLLQMHFHLPSEHQLDGESFNMEGHLVHENKDGGLAVVAFFIKEGKVNTDLADMWAVLPTEKIGDRIEVNHSIDLLEVLPIESEVFIYKGSLTTPPCSEGVLWFVLEEPIEMSSQQIEVFAEIYRQNNRPIQDMNNRKIYKYHLE